MLNATETRLLQPADIPSFNDIAYNIALSPLAAPPSNTSRPRRAEEGPEDSEALISETEHDQHEDDRNATESADQSNFQIEEHGLTATTSKHDDWLHRGPFLASLPYIVYVQRVTRILLYSMFCECILHSAVHSAKMHATNIAYTFDTIDCIA